MQTASSLSGLAQPSSPRVETGSLPGVAPLFIAAAAGADLSLAVRLLNHHPEVHAHGQGLLLRDDAASPAAARDAMAAMAAEAQREATMRVRQGGTARVRFVGAEVDLRDLHAPDRLLEIFPDASLICLIADGRDAVVRARHADLRAERFAGLGARARAHAAAARRFHILGEGEPAALFCPESLRAGVMQWIESLRAPLRAAELLGDRARVVRAEELVADPARTHVANCRWLGVASESGLIHSAVEACRAQLAAAPASGLWRSLLAEAECMAFKRMAGELLVELGYEPDTSW